MVYVVRAYFDTKAEKRDEMIKSGLIVNKGSTVVPNEIIQNKVQEIINNSGLHDHINNKAISTPHPENPEDSMGICG